MITFWTSHTVTVISNRTFQVLISSFLKCLSKQRHIFQRIVLKEIDSTKRILCEKKRQATVCFWKKRLIEIFRDLYQVGFIFFETIQSIWKILKKKEKKWQGIAQEIPQKKWYPFSIAGASLTKLPKGRFWTNFVEKK